MDRKVLSGVTYGVGGNGMRRGGGRSRPRGGDEHALTKNLNEGQVRKERDLSA